jgi:hypothetical protein
LVNEDRIKYRKTIIRNTHREEEIQEGRKSNPPPVINSLHARIPKVKGEPEKAETRSRHYASIMRVRFPKSKQFVELFEAPKGIPNDDRAPQGRSRRFVYPAGMLYN